MAELDGKSCVVTGAASGIGAAIARLYLEAGANVVAVDLAAEPPELGRLLERFPGRLRYVAGDVSLEKTAVDYVREAV